MNVNSATSTAAAATTAAGPSIADNFNTFLTLLTTQLKNQNPLDPLDTNQFTQQLVQFSGVEQQLKTNTYLQTLIESSQVASNTQAVSFIGKKVTSANAKSQLVDGSANWIYSIGKNADSAAITIKDANGNAVYTKKMPLSAGTGSFTWDGVGDAGVALPDGAYSITIDARDSSGNYIPVSTQMTGQVVGVDLSGSQPVLKLNGGATVPMSSVIAVNSA
ncbi:MAG TPA: flagellar hook capping FlgD N-terminal domain-containing protein [Devosiaceae bacterium]